MCKYVVLFLVISLSMNFANAFESKLKMNKPNTIIATHEGRYRQSHYPNHHQHYPHYNCPECHYNGDYLSHGNLNALEKYALNKTYRKESDLTRLERLENLAFGATQLGDLDSRYTNVEQAILSRPKYKTKNSMLGSLANFLAGTPTGYTPAIDSKSIEKESTIHSEIPIPIADTMAIIHEIFPAIFFINTPLIKYILSITLK